MATQNCPCCDSSLIHEFFEINGVPAHSCLLMSSRDQALAYPRGDLKLGFCAQCAFVFNTALDPRLQEYSRAYEESQGFSPTFNRFAQELAQALVSQFDLHGKKILEIGCGKGDFLVLLCSLGHNQGIGIDPTCVPERIPQSVSDRIRLLPELYSKNHSHVKADFVCCRHTLEHIAAPAELLRELRAALDEGVPVFFEVPDVLRVLHEGAFWDIYYEHCSYFTTGSLARVFRSTGFDVIDVGLAYEGQYILLNAVPSSSPDERHLVAERDVELVQQAVRDFPDVVARQMNFWKDLLARNADRRVVIWGSSSKGVSFLTSLGVGLEVDYVVDVNPYRHGKFMPGSGHEIVAPEFLRSFQPELVLVMNPVYVPEISQQLEALGVHAEVAALTSEEPALSR